VVNGHSSVADAISIESSLDSTKTLHEKKVLNIVTKVLEGPPFSRPSGLFYFIGVDMEPNVLVCLASSLPCVTIQSIPLFQLCQTLHVLRA